MTLDGQHPEIDYPCQWGFRLIGTVEADMRALILDVVGDGEHELEYGQASRGGKYVSLHLTMWIRDDEHRLAVYGRFSEAECVRMVL